MAKRISRRRLFEILAGLPFVSAFARGAAAQAQPKTRARPGEPGWPSDAAWDELNRQVEGRLVKVRSPLAACVRASFDATCAQTFKELKNPYYLGDEVGLTQSLGWVGAWTPQPSVYAVAAETTRRRRRRGQFRPDEQSAAGREGRRPQLPGHLQRGRFAADLDAEDERDRPARRLRRRGLRRAVRSRSRRCRSKRARSGRQVYDAVTTRADATSRAAAA